MLWLCTGPSAIVRCRPPTAVQRWLSTDGPGFVNRASSGYYRVKGHEHKLFPSVTTVLKVIDQPGLEAWQRNLILSQFEKAVAGAASSEDLRDASTVGRLRKSAEQAPQEILSSASNFGIRSHDLLSRLSTEQDVPHGLQTADMAPILAAYLAWKQRFPCEIVHSERMVYSLQHTYAGTADAIGQRVAPDGQRVRFVLDWKTSSVVSPNFALQLAAYAKACEEMDGQPVREAYVVSFDKQAPTYRIYKVADIERSWTAFRSTLSLWRYMQATSHFVDVA